MTASKAGPDSPESPEIFRVNLQVREDDGELYALLKARFDGVRKQHRAFVVRELLSQALGVDGSKPITKRVEPPPAPKAAVEHSKPAPAVSPPLQTTKDAGPPPYRTHSEPPDPHPEMTLQDKMKIFFDLDVDF